MLLISRITRLFKADFHAVLDQVEDPLMLLKQAVREMEEEVNAAELRQRRTAVERDALKERRDELECSLQDLEGELDICFEEEQVELARDLIRRKLQTRRLARHIEARLAAAEQAISQGQKVLLEHRATLESTRQKAELFSPKRPADRSDPSQLNEITWNPQALAVSDNDVEVALLQEKKRRAQP